MSIPFVHAFDFAYGRADRVSPLLTRIVADNPGPFTQAGTNSYIVGAGDEVALIDPGPALPAHEAALERALEGKRLAGVFLTHAHADHSPLSRPLAHRHGCPILAFPFASGAGQGDGPTMEAGMDPDFRVDVALEDGMVRRGPDWTLTAIHTPGHASNHACFALAEETALICGDHVMGWATSVVIPPDGDMTDPRWTIPRRFSTPTSPTVTPARTRSGRSCATAPRPSLTWWTGCIRTSTRG
jgi:glyoxylase-like metal-dependent hydrolase (beta-lactamase superfamily II)